MADLSVTIGADNTELEKGMKDAGKIIKKGIPSDGLSVGAMGLDALLNIFKRVTSFFAEFAQRSKELVIASNATGLSVEQLSVARGLAERSGVSFQTLTQALVEFDKRMGAAKIRGGELNNIMAKMGVGMKDVANGSFKAQDGLMALAAAYDAGTDAQTLAYYGNLMFGSSFEQMLPLIKQGTINIEKFAAAAYKVPEAPARSLNNAGQVLENTVDRVGAGLTTIAGYFTLAAEDIVDETSLLGSKVKGFFQSITDPQKAGKEYAQAVKEQMSAGKSKEEQKKYFEYYGSQLGGKSKEAYDAEVKKIMEGNGQKLSPFGMAEAGGASQMQQMGGGDIFGAVAFTPLERIATATEQTAVNTRPEENNQRPPDNLAR